MNGVEKYSQADVFHAMEKIVHNLMKQLWPLSFLHEIYLYPFIISFITGKTMP